MATDFNKSLDTSTPDAKAASLSIMEIYKREKEKKAAAERFEAEKINARVEELRLAAEPAWAEVRNKMQDMHFTVHRSYDSAWGRLFDLLMRLDAAVQKEAPVNRMNFSAAIAPYSTSFSSHFAAAVGAWIGTIIGEVVSYLGVENGKVYGGQLGAQLGAEAVGVLGGACGALIGGVGSLFGLSKGMKAGYNAGRKYMLGKPTEGFRHYVDVREDGSLDYWVKRADGKAMDSEYENGFIADVNRWLAENDYEEVQPFTFKHKVTGQALDRDTLANLRDNEQKGLNSYFYKTMEKFGLGLESELELEKAPVEVIQETPCPRPSF